MAGARRDKAIIIDLDGTLSDSAHRQHFMEKTPKDWKAFYAALVDDPPNQWCRELLIRFRSDRFSHFYEIILVSGRSDDYREVTEAWLDKHKLSYDRLLMRKFGDFRADYIVKEEIYKAEIEPHCDVLFAVDDRKQVVDMWRRNGIVCLQCAEGNF